MSSEWVVRCKTYLQSGLVSDSEVNLSCAIILCQIGSFRGMCTVHDVNSFDKRAPIPETIFSLKLRQNVRSLPAVRAHDIDALAGAGQRP